MVCNFWTWLNFNSGALGVIAAFSLAVVTFLYVPLMKRSVEATEKMVKETSRQWLRIDSKSRIFYLVKIGNYQKSDEQMNNIIALTPWSAEEITQILQELHYEGRVEEDANLIWRAK